MNPPIAIEEFPAWFSEICAAIDSPDLRPPLKEWLEKFIDDLRQGFQAGQSQLGQAWAPLKRRRPAGHDAGSSPLIDTGNLMRSVDANSPEGHQEIATDALTFGSSVPYARYQQAGTNRIPARSFLNVNPDQAARSAELIARQIIMSLGSRGV